jgi:putative transposase
VSVHTRARADQALTAEIRRIHQQSGGAYGAPGSMPSWEIACGVRVGRKRVARLMRSAGLVGCHRRKRWRPATTRRDPKARPAPDLVNRQFVAQRPDRLWHGDLTELPTLEGRLYLAVLVDGCSRLVVGHAIGEHPDVGLAVGALELAVGRRGGVLDQAGGLSATPTRAAPTPQPGSASGCNAWGSAPRWAVWATASTTPWSKASTPPLSVS